MAEDTEKKEKKGGGAMKMIIIGIPLFIIQAVAIYFVLGNFLLDRFETEIRETAGVTEGQSEEGASNSHEKNDGEEVELGKFIHSVEDIIVNPAGTDGKKLVLASLGFDVNSEEALKELEEKNIIVKDIIISIMSRKRLSQLKKVTYKDSLKVQITESVENFIPDLKINRIYFSKYIIQ